MAQIATEQATEVPPTTAATNPTAVSSNADTTVTTTANNAATNDDSKDATVLTELTEEKDASLLAIGVSNELPLQFRWALWYSAPKSADAEGAHKWDTERAKQIVEFGSVEEFWRVFNNLTPPSTLAVGADFQLFRSGVKPAWEDPFNQKGGTWTVRVHKDDNAKLDTTWFNTVLTVIGDNFDDADDICGITVSIRSKVNRVQLWTRDAGDRDACRRIGRQLKDINRLKNTINFLSHDDSKDRKDTRPSEMSL